MEIDSKIAQYMKNLRRATKIIGQRTPEALTENLKT